MTVSNKINKIINNELGRKEMEIVEIKNTVEAHDAIVKQINDLINIHDPKRLALRKWMLHLIKVHQDANESFKITTTYVKLPHQPLGKHLFCYESTFDSVKGKGFDIFSRPIPLTDKTPKAAEFIRWVRNTQFYNNNDGE